MIILRELLHSIDKEEKSGMINTDDWRWPDVDHLVAMGFEFDGDYQMKTNKEPEIKIYKKKEVGKDKKPVSYFYIEEKDRVTKRFANFNDVIDYFDTYSQPELDKNV